MISKENEGNKIFKVTVFNCISGSEFLWVSPQFQIKGLEKLTPNFVVSF